MGWSFVMICSMKGVIGIDEVGRGCWAGPLLVVAAREVKKLPEGLKDSKQLTRKQRENFAKSILACCEFGEGWVMPVEIDQLGLSEAMRLGTKRALEDLGAQTTDKIIFDGNISYCPPEFVRASAVVGADALFPIVSAASIYAKVKRDKYMADLPARYAHYEFDRHVGYGTKRHSVLLKRYGVSDIHRKSFAPIRALL